MASSMATQNHLVKFEGLGLMCDSLICNVALTPAASQKDCLSNFLKLNVMTELMLVGFISLTITALRDLVNKYCVSSSKLNQWTPCKISQRPNSPDYYAAPTPIGRRLLEEIATNYCQAVCDLCAWCAVIIWATFQCWFPWVWQTCVNLWRCSDGVPWWNFHDRVMNHSCHSLLVNNYTSSSSCWLRVTCFTHV